MYNMGYNTKEEQIVEYGVYIRERNIQQDIERELNISYDIYRTMYRTYR
jgi:hypothetical protein